MKRAGLDLHIEELVLDGVDGLDGPRVGAAVQKELARLAAASARPPALRGSGAIAEVDGGSFEVAAEETAPAVGERIARAVHRGLER